MIRINYHHQLIMNKRRIPCLDGYLDRINLTLWPRFKASHSSPLLVFSCCCCFLVPLCICTAALTQLSPHHVSVHLVVMWHLKSSDTAHQSSVMCLHVYMLCGSIHYSCTPSSPAMFVHKVCRNMQETTIASYLDALDWKTIMQSFDMLIHRPATTRSGA